MFLAKIMNPSGIDQSSDTPNLDVDDISRLQFNGARHIVERMHALVQADGVFDPLTQERMKVDVVFVERLLDHQQIETIPSQS